MQKYFKHPDSQKVISFDISGLAQLDNLRRRGYVEVNVSERIAYITKRAEEDKEKLDEERATAVREGWDNIYYMAPMKNDDGYGQSCRNIRELIKNHGILLDPVHTNQKVGLCYHLPNTLQLVKTPIRISYTMFETDQYPKFWEPYLKSADHVLVPTQFCADVMERNFGIKPEVVPLGYFPEVFTHIERKKGDVFTFLHYDAFKWRKGWDILFKAFNDEFEHDEDVRLLLKTTMVISPPLHEYPKIKVVKGRIPQEEFKQILTDADCFIFPTRGEGFGLTPLEAMATGMPTIIPNHSGITHYFNPKYSYGLEYKPIKAKYDNLELWGLELGNLQEPTYESTREQMRRAYNDWKAGTFYQHSLEMAEYAKQFTIHETTKKLSAILKRFV